MEGPYGIQLLCCGDRKARPLYKMVIITTDYHRILCFVDRATLYNLVNKANSVHNFLVSLFLIILINFYTYHLPVSKTLHFMTYTLVILNYPLVSE
jgi:hypothetical protein